MSETPSSQETSNEKEDVAFLIRALWSSLLTPAWPKDDLIEFGKLIFSKIQLKEMDEALFARLLPKLSQVAKSLRHQIMQREPSASPAPSSSASPTEPSPRKDDV